ncbi:hypothetical protein [Dactylosporangium sp. NPDC048998]|uniref:hypothetical protein n=1 Tax=Dactylosporangium sp. NPDC048998 TaxID=3363976 RepID=UPI00371B2EEF
MAGGDLGGVLGDGGGGAGLGAYGVEHGLQGCGLLFGRGSLGGALVCGGPGFVVLPGQVGELPDSGLGLLAQLGSGDFGGRGARAGIASTTFGTGELGAQWATA